MVSQVSHYLIKRAVMPVTNMALRELLMLPEAVRVVGVTETSEDRAKDQVTVILEGDGLPDGCRIPSQPLDGWAPYRFATYYRCETFVRPRFVGFDPHVDQSA